jgi:uncharacterized RDD family membrane protein YckC
MELEDTLTITTPEGVELDLSLAGLGSRFMAQLLDLLIKATVVGLIALTLAIAGLTGVAIMLPAFFLVMYAYDVVFETFANGRTPGKMATRLRVVRVGGEPIDFMSSAIRNVLRLIDGLPFSYLPGMISILATNRNQRLGDLAAGTIVIHEEPVAKPGGAGAAWTYAPPAPPPPTWNPGPVWDVSQVSAAEVAAVRSFLERRWQIDHGARMQLALQLADALWPKVAGATPGLAPEQFLEQLAQQKAQRA